MQCTHANGSSPAATTCPCCLAPADRKPAPIEEDCKDSPLTEEEITQSLNERSYVLISAGRNTSAESVDSHVSPADIDTRNKELRHDLCRLKLRFISAEGHYNRNSEPSFFVLVPEAEQRLTLLLLGAQYHQDSIIFGNGGRQTMVYTTGFDVGTAQAGKGWNRFNESKEDNYTAITLANGKRLKFCLNFADAKSVRYQEYLDWMQTAKVSPAMEAAEGNCNAP